MATVVDNSVIQDKVLKFEIFINDVLKENLKRLNKDNDFITSELSEWIQLKTTINTLLDNRMDSLKCKMDIGCNIFAQAFVPDTSKIILNLGAGVYAEFNLEEALRVANDRITLYEQHLVNIDEASCDVKARIKLVLHGIQELENIK